MRLITIFLTTTLFFCGTAWASDADFHNLLDLLLRNGTITNQQYENLLQENTAHGNENIGMSTAKETATSTIKSPFSMTMEGALMTDVAIYDADKNLLGNGTELRRALIGITGILHTDWDYELGVDFTDGTADIKDAYLSYVATPSAKITVGQFKEPFSLEELTSLKYVTFMERALPNELAPGRNIGIGLHTWGKMWTYGIGLFGEGFDDDVANEGDEGWGASTRVTVTPLNSDLTVFHIGFALAHRRPGDENQIKFDSRPESHITDVKYLNTEYIADVYNYSRYGSELAVVYGPFSIQGEYIHIRMQRNTGLKDLNFAGWYGYVSWFLTDDSRKYKTKKGAFGVVKPKKHYGALEVAARYSALDLNDEMIFGGRGKNITFGINWYANAHVRFMANYILVDNDVHADDAGTFVAVDDDPRIFQMRLQVKF